MGKKSYDFWDMYPSRNIGITACEKRGPKPLPRSPFRSCGRAICAEANHTARIAEHYPVKRLSVISDPLPDKPGFRVGLGLRLPFSPPAEILHYASRVGFVESPAFADVTRGRRRGAVVMQCPMIEKWRRFEDSRLLTQPSPLVRLISLAVPGAPDQQPRQQPSQPNAY